MRAIALLCILSVALASTADSALYPADEPALIERTAEGARAPFKITSATVDADALHAAHKTKYRFENGSPQDNTLIVRRGWNVTFTVVTEPIPADNTVDACIGTDSLSCGSTVVSVDAKRTNWVVRLTIPPTFAVGSTQFSAYVMQAVRGSTSINGQLKLTKKVIVLLNPYNPADDAYVPDPSELADYFENEKGAVWKGSSSDFFWAPWAFDHFSTVILYRTTFIVDRLDEKTRKNPVLLARAVAQAMNTVLEGRWNPPYDDGVLPEQWVSSLDIFKMAVAKGKAKYGQCMVFGCVTTSALRTLGFAARPITGYNFATNGDGDALVTIKWDLDAKGNYFPSPSNTEKMWYFHVWTEVLLRRTDLKSTTPEWNIIDGTWHAGPGSVAKFNALDLKSPYDLPAYNAAVNAKLVWANYNNATKKYDKIIENPLVIGDKFLTKGLDSKCSPKWNDNGSQYTSLCYIDRILDYKKRGAKPPAFFEVAATPRQTPRQQVRASASGSKPQLQGQTKIGSNYAAPDASGNRKVVVGDYELTSFVPKAQIIGHEQTITLKYKYVGAGAPKNPITHLGVSVVLRSYSGETIAAVKSERLATPDPKAGSIKVTLTTADFKKLAAGKQLQASRTFVFSFQAFAKTDLVFFDSRPLAMQPPRLNMLCGSKTVNVGSTVACNIFVTNPFQFELPVKQLEVRVTGQGAPVVQSPSAIAANKRVSFDSVKVKTFKAGKQWFMASLKSDYLPDITGVMEITVVGK